MLKQTSFIGVLLVICLQCIYCIAEQEEPLSCINQSQQETLEQIQQDLNDIKEMCTTERETGSVPGFAALTPQERGWRPSLPPIPEMAAQKATTGWRPSLPPIPEMANNRWLNNNQNTLSPVPLPTESIKCGNFLNCILYFDGCNVCDCTGDCGFSGDKSCEQNEFEETECLQCQDGYSIVDGECILD
mmetsp:Transcript_71290/g.63993  ORF Transcript_71290/g.63993 Transcript_71290/m.63993 type:complete len:188 (-) Transcript_71290:114-677(-)